MTSLRNVAVELIRWTDHGNITAGCRRHAAHPNEHLELLCLPAGEDEKTLNINHTDLDIRRTGRYNVLGWYCSDLVPILTITVALIVLAGGCLPMPLKWIQAG